MMMLDCTGSCHCAWVSLVVEDRGYSLAVVLGFFFVVASLVVEHGALVFGLQYLWFMCPAAPRHVGSSQTRD